MQVAKTRTAPIPLAVQLAMSTLRSLHNETVPTPLLRPMAPPAQAARPHRVQKTSGGAKIAVGAAVALSVVDASSEATVTSTGSITATSGTGIVIIRSNADVDATTTADASAASGTSGTAVGVAVSINFVNVTNTASVLGTVSANALTIEAITPAAAENTLGATSTSGGSGGNAIAVSLALNIANVDTIAEIGATGTTTVTGGDVAVTAHSMSGSTASATPNPVVGDALGIGTSVALNIVDDAAVARVVAGAALLFAAARCVRSHCERRPQHDDDRRSRRWIKRRFRSLQLSPSRSRMSLATPRSMGPATHCWNFWARSPSLAGRHRPHQPPPRQPLAPPSLPVPPPLVSLSP